MVRFCASNIALTAYGHDGELGRFAEMGLGAIEVAPSRIWHDTWHGLKPADVAAYLRAIENAGLSVVGLHALFYDHPELGLFRDAEGRRQTLEFLEHLSAVCRDLGGCTLIWGGGRRRDEVPADAAEKEAVAFMDELCQRIADHGTCICFEPLGPADTDFINSALDALAIVELVDHPALAVQLDAKALVANGEADADTFRAVARHLVHFHANEPDLGVLGSSGQVDHGKLGELLRAIDYDGFVSIEQRQLNPDDPIPDLARSADVLRACYQTSR
jgi:sugar phosphate isomerase/epimerase